MPFVPFSCLLEMSFPRNLKFYPTLSTCKEHDPIKKELLFVIFRQLSAFLDHGPFLVVENGPIIKKLPHKRQKRSWKRQDPGCSRNFLVEPGTSGQKFLVEPRSLQTGTLPGTMKMKNLKTRYLTGKPSSW